MSAHAVGTDRGVATAAWSLYLVRRADGALYTGITTDVQRRIGEHAKGGARAARSLRARGPLALVYHATLGTRATALRAELKMKSLCKRDKEAVVSAQPCARALLRRLGIDGR